MEEQEIDGIFHSYDSIVINFQKALRNVDILSLLTHYFKILYLLNNSFNDVFLIRKPKGITDEEALKLIANFLAETNELVYPSDVSEILDIPYEQTVRIFRQLKSKGAIGTA
ncbi:MAG: hypothetical protein ACP5NK_00905 [Thermoplasmata archaeon]